MFLARLAATIGTPLERHQPPPTRHTYLDGLHYQLIRRVLSAARMQDVKSAEWVSSAATSNKISTVPTTRLPDALDKFVHEHAPTMIMAQ